MCSAHSKRQKKKETNPQEINYFFPPRTETLEASVPARSSPPNLSGIEIESGLARKSALFFFFASENLEARKVIRLKAYSYLRYWTSLLATRCANPDSRCCRALPKL